jgi:hypothetical protein
MLDMCTVDNSMHIKFVFQFDPYILQQKVSKKQRVSQNCL